MDVVLGSHQWVEKDTVFLGQIDRDRKHDVVVRPPKKVAKVSGDLRRISGKSMLVKYYILARVLTCSLSVLRLVGLSHAKRFCDSRELT